MKAKPIYALLAAVVIVVVYRATAFTGHFGYDDMQYAGIAARMLNGEVDFDDHYTYRFTVNAATAISYKLFGVNDFASSLPAMTLTVLTLWLIYLVLRRKGFWPTATGLAMTLASSWLLFYSNKLMPDIYVVFFTMAAVYVYYRQRYETQGRTVGRAALFAGALLLGFMSKGSVVLLVPWLVYLFVADCIARRGRKFWTWAIAFGALYLAVYFAGIYLLTGDILYRFKAIAQNSYLNTCSYSEQPLRVLLQRVAYDFFDMTIATGMAVPMVFAVAALADRNWRKMLALPDPLSYFALSATVMFLSSNFMTISATSYSPMCVDPRHYLFFVPVAAVGAALLLQRGPTKGQTVGMGVALTALSIYTLFGNRTVFLQTYLPVTVAMAGMAAASWKRPQAATSPLAKAALLAALLVQPVATMADGTGGYTGRREVIKENVCGQDDGRVVVSDPVCTRVMQYYDGFGNNGRYLDYEEYESLAAASGTPQRVTLVLNDHTMGLSGTAYSDLPDFAYSARQRRKADTESCGVRLYQLEAADLAPLAKDTLLCSSNDFEGEVPEHWRSGYTLSQRESHTGAASNKTDSYSAIFEYPADSLRALGHERVEIRVAASCNCFSQTDCVLAVSVEDGSGSLSWNSSGVSKSMVAYSHWFRVTYKQDIDIATLPPGCRIVVYFYKSDKAEVYVDDFSVCFVGIER